MKFYFIYIFSLSAIIISCKQQDNNMDNINEPWIKNYSHCEECKVDSMKIGYTHKNFALETSLNSGVAFLKIISEPEIDVTNSNGVSLYQGDSVFIEHYPTLPDTAVCLLKVCSFYPYDDCFHYRVKDTGNYKLEYSLTQDNVKTFFTHNIYVFKNYAPILNLAERTSQCYAGEGCTSFYIKLNYMDRDEHL